MVHGTISTFDSSNRRLLPLFQRFKEPIFIGVHDVVLVASCFVCHPSSGRGKAVAWGCVCEIRMPTAIASMCALCDAIACIDGRGRWVGCRQVVKERSGCAQAQEGEGGCGDVGGGGKVKVLNDVIACIDGRWCCCPLTRTCPSFIRDMSPIRPPRHSYGITVVESFTTANPECGVFKHFAYDLLSKYREAASKCIHMDANDSEEYI
jgi:hypothetical protein